jgi:hypothetical protein
MTKAYLGSQSAPDEIEALLRTYKLSYERSDDPAERAAENELLGTDNYSRRNMAYGMRI